jgi:tRNA-Thr(GGU) m(6)t(6)A37 methyltransferase TsaA
MTRSQRYSLQAIGIIRSALRTTSEAPKQGSEGAPDAWLEVEPAFADALFGIGSGDELVIITWFDRADRDVLQVRPRKNPANPLTGVFATRSPARPNPLGLHRVTVREISGTRLRVGPIEAIDGTPVVDIKPVISPCGDG